jgi:hypothetical protein
MLFCTVCHNEVPQGFAQCVACKVGYARELACATCRKVVPRGVSSCAACERRSTLVPASPPAEPLPLAIALPTLPPPPMALLVPSSAPPAMPGLPAHISRSLVPEVYQAGKFGVDATVRIPALDVEILNEMASVVVILHTLASKMNNFQGISESTRHVIRQCRMLATELQDEIETRRGPLG